MVLIAPLFNALAAVAHVSPVARDASPNALAARQVDTGSLPAQCQTSCQVVNTMTNCDSSLSCICTSSIGSQLQSCMSCLTETEPSVQSDAQSSLDSWNEACGGTLSLSGGSTSPTSTSSGSGLATLASSSTTTTSSTTTASSSSSSSNPFSGSTGGAVGMRTITGAFGLAVAIACGILIL
ncbi:hypothetical protein K503DRAFT_866294 [Rhizopogon vinicolor AM-OR11-026]|uniref:Extracellular membrane protein CFEM domain-containing protein n=1 Tax=Rhizopogon vinicolor AM-OR11-026 TaxID=1314800 RepID=A0A1B7N060_9AGAM|nr:hypothetical protein K503DRAFT_866294 [Rhizopogon vinicolor AM-OR11-026]